jgi:hypothetical protein
MQLKVSHHRPQDPDPGVGSGFFRGWVGDPILSSPVSGALQQSVVFLACGLILDLCLHVHRHSFCVTVQMSPLYKDTGHSRLAASFVLAKVSF